MSSPTQFLMEALGLRASDAVALYDDGRDAEARAMVGEVAGIVTRLGFDPWTSFAGEVIPPDPQPESGWKLENTRDGQRATLTSWAPAENDLQRRLSLTDIEPSKIAVTVRFTPPDGWRAGDRSYSAGQLTQGPLGTDGHTWKTSLLGACAIKSEGPKARFTVCDGVKNSGRALTLGRRSPFGKVGKYSVQYTWTPRNLDFSTGGGTARLNALEDVGADTVFAIGNNAAGNEPGDAWSLGWVYDEVIVETVQ